jgi:hypothetical protein
MGCLQALSSGGNETTLTEADRLSEYRASKVPRILHWLLADDPYYKDLEIARLAGYWQEAIDVDCSAAVGGLSNVQTPSSAQATPCMVNAAFSAQAMGTIR